MGMRYASKRTKGGRLVDFSNSHLVLLFLLSLWLFDTCSDLIPMIFTDEPSGLVSIIIRKN